MSRDGTSDPKRIGLPLHLPADAMKTVCEGKIIAIDVSAPIDLLQNTDYDDSVSGWKILWKKLFPGAD